MFVQAPHLLTIARHAHIYGIDLASRRELVAHQRAQEDIASYIGADAVIYQTLDDLQGACADLSPRGTTQQFEIGVFCGRYITPVDDAYLAHLEQVRNNAQRFKERERARLAIANGVSMVNATARRLTNGDDAAAAAGVHYATAGWSEVGDFGSAGNIGALEEAGIEARQDPTPEVRDRMDINLHNLGDYPER